MCVKNKNVLSIVLVVLLFATIVDASGISLKTIYYETPSDSLGTQIIAHIIIKSITKDQKTFMFQIVRDEKFSPDEVVYSVVKTVTLSPGDNDVAIKFFPPNLGEYFVRVYYNEGGQWIRLDPWRILNIGRPSVSIQFDNPPVEDVRTITSLPYTIIDTITYRIRYDTKYGGPIYCDRYFLDLKANQKIRIMVESLNGNKFSVLFLKDNGDFGGKPWITYFETTYSPTKNYRMEIRIYADGDQEYKDVTKYKLYIEEVRPPTPAPTPTPTPSIVPIETPTQTPTTKTPGFEAAFALTGLIALAFLLRRGN